MELGIVRGSIDPHFVDDFEPAVSEPAQGIGMTLRLGRDLLSASSPKEPESCQCLDPARSPLAQNHLQNVDRSNPLQCRAPSPQSTPTRLLDLSASKILTPTIFPLKTDRKSTDHGGIPLP